RADALAGLTHPRSEAMFVHAGLAAFDGELTAADVTERRERHHQDATAFLDDYRHAGPADDPVAALAEHAEITDWGHTGVRLTRANERHEYENTVLRVAELAQGVEWGRAYAADARHLHEHYVSTFDDPRDYGARFECLDETRESLEATLARRQEQIQEGVTFGWQREDSESVYRYLYRDLDATYPVLADGTRVLARMDDVESRITTALTAQA
ncbi:hypothetical protein ACFQEQ_08120, partial [Halolamina salina]|uniref:DUF7260 family protein n=1 Tax=Halolamina salina TaxID=1220023 RepID=UPI003614A3CF